MYKILYPGFTFKIFEKHKLSKRALYQDKQVRYVFGLTFFKNLRIRKFSQTKMCLQAKPLSICPGLISDIILEFLEAAIRVPHFALFQKYFFFTFLYFPQNRSGWRNVVTFTYLRNFPYQFPKEYQLYKFPATKGIAILPHCTVEHR